MNVSAPYFSTIRKAKELSELSTYKPYKNGILFLGGGSNILLTQQVSNWVLHNEIKGIDKIKEDENFVWLKVGSGEIWHDFVLFCVDHNYGGVENLSLIPGTIGAAPIQNIGAYGAEAKDVIENVRFFNLENKTFESLDCASCAFEYRNSIFKNKLSNKAIITSVTFRLKKHPKLNIAYGTIRQILEQKNVSELTIKHISDAVIHIRSTKLPNPNKIGNAGSFFKNPEITNSFFNQLKLDHPNIPGYKISETRTKIPAAWLIEQCGWKGFKEKNYGVHKNQPLVLVNYGGAKGIDIFNLSEKILQSVQQRFDILLQREVRIL